MACITKRRNRWIVDFYDTHGKRRWITMPKGATKNKAHDKLRAEAGDQPEPAVRAQMRRSATELIKLYEGTQRQAEAEAWKEKLQQLSAAK